jgi:hypothetical protein
VADANVNDNIFRLITQQWTETTYTDESNYDLNTRSVPDFWWNIIYRDCLRDFEEAKALIPTDVTDAGQQKNELAITDMHEVYAFALLINTFGDIPYTQALKSSILFPKYDDAKTVYYDLVARLDADIAALDASSGSFGQADLVYGGDIASWKKFANSLKLTMGMLLADFDAAKAKTEVEAAAAGVFTSNSDNTVFQFLTAPPNTNPVWVNLVQSGRNDFVPANTLVDMMTNLNDPRLPFYFTQDGNGNYTGGVPGKGNSYPSFSHFPDAQIAPDAPFVLLDYAWVEFNLAEAVERGFNVGGTAQDHYNKAITASIEQWGGTAGDAATYLANTAVNYTTAAGNYKQKIGAQEYIALYNRGFDAWTEIRRFNYPVMKVPVNALSDFPLRFTYPVLEQNINTSNYTAASSAIGGDAVTTKLFWNK